MYYKPASQQASKPASQQASKLKKTVRYSAYPHVLGILKVSCYVSLGLSTHNLFCLTRGCR